ncbi:hypothetical protein [Mesorhizobium erdmanii]|uniref:Uncharacterized protein n=1 Tax=Mesorhizobium erdmanii TaxID=1777866 RepID=A0A6M7ULI1_9HYPH|nr:MULTISPECIES: hypothetical protein [Mesorhizobium]OBQ74788.1 hypothetical protein A8146_03340 [Mesorhizobium loti]QKC76948.1 hypothetical protein EB233_16690 [Mesorhizobium erdmanii]
MSKKTRLILTMVVMEAALASIWWYLARYGLDNPDRVTPDFQAIVGQTMGMAMGALLGVGVVLLFFAAGKDRKAMADKIRR